MNLTEEQYKQACRDYERGYTMVAERLWNGCEYSVEELYLMDEDEIAAVFDIESKYMAFGIQDCLCDLESMTSTANVTSVRLS